MGAAKQLNINNTVYDINDIRVSTGTAAPSGGSNGDIYFRKVGGVDSNGWSYTIRPDGICECWKVYELGSVSFGSWGSYYSKDNVLSNLTFPVTFSAKPTIIISASADMGPWVFTAAGYTGSTTTSMNCGLVCLGTPSTNTRVNVYVIGKVAV